MVLAPLIHWEKCTWPFFIYCTATRTNPVMPHALEMKHRIPEMHLCFYYLKNETSPIAYRISRCI